MHNSISVFIITYNEEARLPATLEAAKQVADEIVIVDSGSNDSTGEIAEQFGATFIFNKFEGYGSQKIFAENQCKNRWLLNLDADEVMTAELIEELLVWKQKKIPPEIEGYEIDILNVYPGDCKPRWLARDYRPVRLYDQQRVSFRNHPLFDRVNIKQRHAIGRFKLPIFHFTNYSFDQMVAKGNRLTDLQAKHSANRSISGLKFRIWFEFPFCFLKTYFLRRHVTGGWKGFVFSLNNAYFRTIRICKILERAKEIDHGG